MAVRQSNAIWKGNLKDGEGTMRLGSYPCELVAGSHAQRIYGRRHIDERHRHRFEFNCLYESELAANGMVVSGRSPDGKFVEIAEVPSHPWFIAVQFHPEFQSRPLTPHPLFASFVEAAYQHKTGRLQAAMQKKRMLLRVSTMNFIISYREDSTARSVFMVCLQDAY